MASSKMLMPMWLPRSFEKNFGPKGMGLHDVAKVCKELEVAEKKLKKRRRGASSGLSFVEPYLACEEDKYLRYNTDVFLWKRSMDRVYSPKHCLQRQADVSEVMRGTLMTWLIALTRRLGYTTETLCLTANYVDRFLEQRPIKKDCLQLLGLTCLYLASKQVEPNPLDMEDLVILSLHSYEVAHFRLMKDIVLSHLEFKFLTPTSSYFLFYWIEMASLANKWPYWISRHLLERIVSDYGLSRFRPSLIGQTIFQALSSVASSFDPKTGRSKVDPRVTFDMPLDVSYKGNETLLNYYLRKVVNKLEQKESQDTKLEPSRKKVRAK